VNRIPAEPLFHLEGLPLLFFHFSRAERLSAGWKRSGKIALSCGLCFCLRELLLILLVLFVFVVL